MNIAQRYYRWRKTHGTYRRIDLANDLMVDLRTVERWLSGANAPQHNSARRIEVAITRVERRLSRAGGGKVTMPRG